MKYYNNLPKRMREEYEESFDKAIEDLKQVNEILRDDIAEQIRMDIALEREQEERI